MPKSLCFTQNRWFLAKTDFKVISVRQIPLVYHYGIQKAFPKEELPSLLHHKYLVKGTGEQPRQVRACRPHISSHVSLLVAEFRNSPQPGHRIVPPQGHYPMPLHQGHGILPAFGKPLTPPCVTEWGTHWHRDQKTQI